MSIRPFPDIDRGRRQISLNGGIVPKFSNSGDKLFARQLDSSTPGLDLVQNFIENFAGGSVKNEQLVG